MGGGIYLAHPIATPAWFSVLLVVMLCVAAVVGAVMVGHLWAGLLAGAGTLALTLALGRFPVHLGPDEAAYYGDISHATGRVVWVRRQLRETAYRFSLRPFVIEYAPAPLDQTAAALQLRMTVAPRRDSKGATFKSLLTLRSWHERNSRLTWDFRRNLVPLLTAAINSNTQLLQMLESGHDMRTSMTQQLASVVSAYTSKECGMDLIELSVLQLELPRGGSAGEDVDRAYVTPAIDGRQHRDHRRAPEPGALGAAVP